MRSSLSTKWLTLIALGFRLGVGGISELEGDSLSNVSDNEGIDATRVRLLEGLKSPDSGGEVGAWLPTLEADTEDRCGREAVEDGPASDESRTTKSGGRGGEAVGLGSITVSA
jgi:hypothetical protein